MDKRLTIPPHEKSSLTPPGELAEKLSSLIGSSFNLTGKPRTDGSRIRKLVGETLLDKTPPEVAQKASYQIVPPKEKGVPKIKLEYVDTYIVTTGKSYNLQVWNRNPSTDSVQIKYSNGDSLSSSEVRFVLVKVNAKALKIESIVVATSDYIVERFGSFGKPTVKSQLIIAPFARKEVLDMPDRLLFYDDINEIGRTASIENLSGTSIHSEPTEGDLLPLSAIREVIVHEVIGQPIVSSSNKTRGQALEAKVASSLGYNMSKTTALAGGYPDIRNQALEVKIQDSPTVDLGKYSPEFEELIPECGSFTTQSMRYFIALTNLETSIVEGGILCPGINLGTHFTYIANQSYKCQRSIPMSFFNSVSGQAVFNP